MNSLLLPFLEDVKVYHRNQFSIKKLSIFGAKKSPSVYLRDYSCLKWFQDCGILVTVDLSECFNRNFESLIKK